MSSAVLTYQVDGMKLAIGEKGDGFVLAGARDQVVVMFEDGGGRPGFGLGSSRLGTGIAAEVPDQAQLCWTSSMVKLWTARRTRIWSLQRSVRSMTSRIRALTVAQGSAPPWPRTTLVQPRTAR